jgi:hypothetical protein
MDLKIVLIAFALIVMLSFVPAPAIPIRDIDPILIDPIAYEYPTSSCTINYISPTNNPTGVEYTIEIIYGGSSMTQKRYLTLDYNETPRIMQEVQRLCEEQTSEWITQLGYPQQPTDTRINDALAHTSYNVDTRQWEIFEDTRPIYEAPIEIIDVTPIDTQPPIRGGGTIDTPIDTGVLQPVYSFIDWIKEALGI